MTSGPDPSVVDGLMAAFYEGRHAKRAIDKARVPVPVTKDGPRPACVLGVGAHGKRIVLTKSADAALFEPGDTVRTRPPQATEFRDGSAIVESIGRLGILYLDRPIPGMANGDDLARARTRRAAGAADDFLFRPGDASAAGAVTIGHVRAWRDASYPDHQDHAIASWRADARRNASVWKVSVACGCGQNLTWTVVGDMAHSTPDVGPKTLYSKERPYKPAPPQPLLEQYEALDRLDRVIAATLWPGEGGPSAVNAAPGIAPKRRLRPYTAENVRPRPVLIVRCTAHDDDDVGVPVREDGR